MLQSKGKKIAMFTILQEDMTTLCSHIRAQIVRNERRSTMHVLND